MLIIAASTLHPAAAATGNAVVIPTVSGTATVMTATTAFVAVLAGDNYTVICCCFCQYYCCNYCTSVAAVSTFSAAATAATVAATSGVVRGVMVSTSAFLACHQC